MLSHDNIYWMAVVAAQKIKMRDYEEVLVSYLPLSHVAANMVDIWSSITCKGQVYFADKMAMKGSLLGTLREARCVGSIPGLCATRWPDSAATIHAKQ